MLDARRRAVLEAMGIEVWRARAGGQAPRAGVVGSMAVEDAIDRSVDAASNEPAVEIVAAGDARPVARPESPLPETMSAVEDHAGEVAVTPHPVPDSVATLDWGALREAVSTCQACGLHQSRTQTVFGVGSRDADLMIIGEAPGADEDRQGEPFVGRAGQLLNLMLEAIGFAREQVYIANIIKCRPPGNRDPHIEEAAACQSYLHRQIALIRPKLILSVGRISAHNLLGTEESVGRLRGRVHRFDPGDIPLIVTYHPAYLLRKPQEKAKAWADLQSAYRLLHRGEANS